MNRYWQFLLYLFITLIALELLLSPVPSLYTFYSAAIGALGLSIEATLNSSPTTVPAPAKASESRCLRAGLLVIL
jgi:hypothetical protein